MGLLQRIKREVSNRRTARREAVEQVRNSPLVFPNDMKRKLIEAIRKRKLKRLREAQRAKK